MELVLKKVGYTYFPETTFAREALQQITLTLPTGSFVGIIGPTGSGKSTLVQIMAGLLSPTTGEVYIGPDCSLPNYQQVGLVFQYPEHQLFADTIWEDIAYGPRNLGLSQSEIEERVTRAAEIVGLKQEWLSRSPFQLSGGQMRRVALAGVLAMDPAILILDEPTAGLDPMGRKKLFETLENLRRTKGTTVVLVSHHMGEIAPYADQIFVLNKGRLVFTGPPSHVFSVGKELAEMGLGIPEVSQLIQKLNEGINPPLPLDLFTSEALATVLAKRWKEEDP